MSASANKITGLSRYEYSMALMNLAVDAWQKSLSSTPVCVGQSRFSDQLQSEGEHYAR